LRFIQCKHCHSLYNIDRLDDDVCDNCRQEFSTDEVILFNKCRITTNKNIRVQTQQKTA